MEIYHVRFKVADLITGNGRRRTIHRRRVVRSSGSYKYAGLGVRRRAPRRHLTHHRRTTAVSGYRRPRRTLLGGRSRVHRVHRRHVMLV